MSYRNPKIIVDKSGSMISEAISSGLSKVASSFAEKRKRAAVAGNAETARLNRNSLEKVKRGVEIDKQLRSFGSKTQEEGTKILMDLQQNEADLKDKLKKVKNNDERAAIEKKLINVQTYTDDINNYYVAMATGQSNANDVANNPTQFSNGDTAYNIINDDPNTAEGLNNVFTGQGNGTLSLSVERDDEGYITNTNVTGFGGEGDSAWNYSGNIRDAAKHFQDITHNITQVTEQSNAFMENVLYGENKGNKNNLLGGFKEADAKPTITTTKLDADGDVDVNRFSEIRKWPLNTENVESAISSMQSDAWAKFEVASTQDQISMLKSQFGMSEDESKKIMLSMEDEWDDMGEYAQKEIKDYVEEYFLTTQTSGPKIVKEGNEKDGYSYYQQTEEIKKMSKEEAAKSRLNTLIPPPTTKE